MRFIIVVSLLLSVAYASSCSGEPSVSFYETPVEGDVQRGKFVWSNDFKTVFLQTHREGSGNLLYRSDDEGQTWQDESQQLVNFDQQFPPSQFTGVNTLFHNAKFDHVAITSYGEGLWTGAGPSFVWSWVDTPDKRFHQLIPSPHEDLQILGLSMTPECYTLGVADGACHNDLFLSADWGKHWTRVDVYVQQAAWDYDNPGKFYFTKYDVNEGAQNSLDPRATSLWRIETNKGEPTVGNRLTEHCAGFFISENTLIIATYDEDNLGLHLSMSFDDGGRFKQAIFPQEDPSESLREYGYAFLESSSNGAVFVAVRHSNEPWCNLYVAGSLDGHFQLSLPRLAGPAEHTDFMGVHSVAGIFLANQYPAPEDSEQTATLADTHTRISFNNGAEWIPLSQDLQLSGANQAGTKFYSASTAIGMLIGVGKPGDSVPDRTADMDTYLSSDGGLSWIKVAEGDHTYEFGDQGGLLVMARADAVANKFIFSWDEGINWTECRLDEGSQLEVDNIRIEPSSSSRRFIMHGRRGEQHVLLSIDFSKMHERACALPEEPGSPESDYQIWTPIPAFSSSCILGKEMEYIRRIPTRPCYNEREQSHIVVKRCRCTRDDYECDDCYRIDHSTGNCVKFSSLCPDPVDHCKILGANKYIETQGYRLAPGDQCAPADPRYEPQLKDCPPPAVTQTGVPSNVPVLTWAAAHLKIVLSIAAGAVFLIILSTLGLIILGRTNAAVNRIFRKICCCCSCPLKGSDDPSYGRLGISDHSLDLEEEADLMGFSTDQEDLGGAHENPFDSLFADEGEPDDF